MKLIVEKVSKVFRRSPTAWIFAGLVLAVLLATTELALYVSYFILAVLILNGAYHVLLGIGNGLSRVGSLALALFRSIVLRPVSCVAKNAASPHP